MITFLKILFSCVLVFMCYEVISTSLASNLFEQWDFLGGIPWMRATLWDFYANVLVIFTWIAYKEKSLALKIIWLILLVLPWQYRQLQLRVDPTFPLKKRRIIKRTFR